MRKDLVTELSKQNIKLPAGHELVITEDEISSMVKHLMLLGRQANPVQEIESKCGVCIELALAMKRGECRIFNRPIRVE